MEAHQYDSSEEAGSISGRRGEQVIIWFECCLVECCRDPAIERVPMPMYPGHTQDPACLRVARIECRRALASRASPLEHAIAETAIALIRTGSQIASHGLLEEIDIHSWTAHASDVTVCSACRAS